MINTDSKGIISHGVGGDEKNELRQLSLSSLSPEAQAVYQELMKFELGRFLIENGGLNGFWTSYIVMYPERGKRTGLSSDGTSLSETERWLLEKCPIVLATQERFQIFRRLTQEYIDKHGRDGMDFASIPCGLMDDLFTLNYRAIKDVLLTGIDLDAKVVEHVKKNDQLLKPSVPHQVVTADAWKLRLRRSFNLLMSNGLNLYEPNDEQCIKLYKKFAQSLRPGGVLITSFITSREVWTDFVMEDFLRQRTVFAEVVKAKWQNQRTEAQMKEQLEQAGFGDFLVMPDKQHMFFTIRAQVKSK